MRGAKVRLTEISRTGGVALLRGVLPPSGEDAGLRYAAPAGALLRLDGAVAGAFEPGCEVVGVEASAAPRELGLEVEPDPRRPGRRPRLEIEIVPPPPPAARPHPGEGDLAVAGPWSFAEGRRRALRAFVLALAERPTAFLPGQAALYAGLERDDPAFFERVRAAVTEGAIDASVAAFWVESDGNIPGGESLLRSMALARAYVDARLGVVPKVARFPGGGGLPPTFPQLLHHAGVRFLAAGGSLPHPEFVWLGPDGSNVAVAAVSAQTGGLHGFEALALHADRLPRFEGELYAPAERGLWTTRHGLKARRFAIEAALDEAEELCVWCMAVRANRTLTEPLAADLRGAWPIFLRGDARQAIGGGAIPAAYRELDEDYDRVERIAARVLEAAYAVLPRGDLAQRDEREVPPRDDDGAFAFENAYVSARVRRDGTVVDLQRPGERSFVTGANVLRAYADKPRGDEAANLNPRYEKYPLHVRFESSAVEDDALVVRYRVGRSTIVSRISLGAGDPYLRVDAAVLWEERKTLLRLEHWLAIETAGATIGVPHGTLLRAAHGAPGADPEKFEVPGQRFARVDGPAGGFAVLAGEGYGWSVRALRRGGIGLGLSLLRGTTSPDADADRGEHRFAYALLPLAAGAGIGEVERVWRAFAYPPRVRLFACDDPAVLVVACKPADDGDGAIVRVRECDGAARRLRLRCGGRIRDVESADGCERRIEREAAIEDHAIVASLEPYELRTFRVRF